MKASLMIQTLGAYNSLSMIARVKMYFKHIRGKKKSTEPQNLSLFYFLSAPVALQHVVLCAHKLHFHR